MIASDVEVVTYPAAPVEAGHEIPPPVTTTVSVLTASLLGWTLKEYTPIDLNVIGTLLSALDDATAVATFAAKSAASLHAAHAGPERYVLRHASALRDSYTGYRSAATSKSSALPSAMHTTGLATVLRRRRRRCRCGATLAAPTRSTTAAQP